jgi:hypothetical protein
MASVAQHDATLRAQRRSENWLTQMATNRRAVVTTLGLGICAIVFGGAWMCFSGSTNAENQALARWREAQPFQLGGSVSYVDRGVELAGTGSVIVAWPAAFVPHKKYSLTSEQVLAAEIPSTTKSPTGPFLARVDASGRYGSVIQVIPGTECDYYVLVVSNNASGGGSIEPSDRAILGVYFSDPDNLVGDHRYALKRHPIQSGNDCEIDFVLRENTTGG